MVTLITEKLQNQSLDDLTCKTYNINLVRIYQNNTLSKCGMPSNSKLHGEFKNADQPEFSYLS